MILAETLLFIVSLVAIGSILFLLVYFVIVLSDLECDYLNARECCDKLNYWLLPKLIIHCAVIFMLLIHGQFILVLINLPMTIWLLFEHFTVPQGNLGLYDPAEIHNRGQLKKHFNHILYHIGYYLVFFFIYLYCCILALLKGNPNQQVDDQIVTKL